MSRLASSPRSFDQANSRNGSPETRLTAFSPEALRSQFGCEYGQTDSMSRQAARSLAIFERSLGESAQAQDPFMPTPSTRSSGRVQLSPTASSFTPGSFDRNAPACPMSSPTFLPEQDPPNLTILTATSVPDTPGLTSSFVPRGAVDFGPIGGARVSPPLDSEYVLTPYAMYYQFGHFDFENRNRALLIEGASASTTYTEISSLFNHSEFPSIKGPVLNELASHGRIYVGFTNIQQAKMAAVKAKSYYPSWILHGLTAKEFTQKFEPHLVATTSNYEGQVYASVHYDNGNHPTADGRAISHSFKTLLSSYGDIKAFHSIPTQHDDIVTFHVEFNDTRAADNAVSAFSGTSTPGCTIDVRYYKPDVVHHAHAHHPSEEPATRTSPTLINSRSMARRESFVSPNPYMELSPTGRSTIPVGDPAVATWNRRSDEAHNNFRSRHGSGRNRHNAHNNNMNQNHVDIERIRMGLDVRTTIMLRNIPNKIDQAMLNDIVDETSHGKYDFMYLRIDFANNCNVGYAFINFEDPIDIIDFAKARAGRSWNCFNSDKVAEISYATIQGKDCLVQKFRNSSVMLEHPSFRPKIFHTGTGPLAGTEDHFPGPDNPSKMRRSVENAEHVGLFAPRVGQQYRDEQRRRRSQYDRGTTAAERETHWVREWPAHPERMEQIRSNIMNSWYEPTGGNHHHHHHSG
ncbi:putative Meiosis protein MEI2 [Arthroderma uncinatum]|uniref:putative Meiosis protein MEI2 n=1 Tax=Arthroderma uncinatum TaxID=74035 RepID=UPI00144A9AB0|nr:putative Meiosis protein MEI2 [Arthroderma uncinatum]KAF3483589.1 putative Meiosis protein MEI2 [Arthroderma uncinatum]